MRYLQRTEGSFDGKMSDKEYIKTQLTEEEIHEEETTVEVAESTWRAKYVEGILTGVLSSGGCLMILLVVWMFRRKKERDHTQE